MNIIKPITPDGRTGFDQFGQLMTWTAPDEDGSSRGTFIADVRSHKCYICDRGWENTSESLRDQEVESVGSGKFRYYHHTCFFGFRKLKEAYFWSDVLIEGGFLFKTEEVPPRYPHSTPWHRVFISLNDSDRSDSGYRLVVGRRKRVWELRIHGLTLDQADGLMKTFNDVSDTKGYLHASEEDPEFGGYCYVHAYTRDQVIDYLKRFHAAIPASISRHA